MVYGAVLVLLQYRRVYSISTCLSSDMDDTVGPKCRFGRAELAEERAWSRAELLELGGAPAKDGAGKTTDGRLLAATEAASSGFQSGSSLRSSTKSSASADSDAMRRTISTDTLGDSHLSDGHLGAEEKQADTFVHSF